MKGPLWKRLPLLLAALGAVFFWRGGFGLVPVEREITWKLSGDFATIRRVDVQLYDGPTLLERSVIEAPNGATFEPVMKVGLKKGDYRGLVMVYRLDAGSPEVREERLYLDDSTAAITVP